MNMVILGVLSAKMAVLAATVLTAILSVMMVRLAAVALRFSTQRPWRLESRFLPRLASISLPVRPDRRRILAPSRASPMVIWPDSLADSPRWRH
jgi:hypothetical protein